MSIAITGVGAVTPVGLSAVSSSAALRAGIARLEGIFSSTVEGARGAEEPLLGGRVPLEWFDGGPQLEEWPGHERFQVAPPPPSHLLVEDGIDRLVRLATHAASDAWSRARDEGSPPSSWGLFLGVDERDEDGAKGKLAEAIQEALGGFRPALIDVVARGRASALAAAYRASVAIESGKVKGAIVGGVDSLVRPSTVERLISSNTLKDPESNPQGMLPGEAAAFLIFDPASSTSRALARFEGGGIAKEPTAGTDQPNQARGLTAAVRAVREKSPLKAMPLTICDLNGERLRAMEWAFVQTRALGDLRWEENVVTQGEVWHPADCIGDTGAASGAVDLVWGVEALAGGYSGTDRVLVWGASDGWLRGAAILSRER